MGVTQPLLYKYFPTKDELIRAVYERIYLNRWHPDWHKLLTDRSRPLEERLIEFYKQYTSEIFSKDWLRIYLFSGLKGLPINKWFIEKVEENILCVSLREFYAEHGYPDDRPISRREIEHAWILQSGIFYIGVRKFIYHTEVSDPIDEAIEDAVRLFLAGLPSQLAPEAPGAKPEAG